MSHFGVADLPALHRELTLVTHQRPTTIGSLTPKFQQFKMFAAGSLGRSSLLGNDATARPARGPVYYAARCDLHFCWTLRSVEMALQQLLAS